MSLDPDELAIREAFDRRRPAAVPPELLARVEAVPAEARPLRPMPVRLALGVAPWLAVAAAGLVLAFGPRFAATYSGPGTGAGSPEVSWTPANPGGGFANEGVFGLPWVPLLPLLALLVAGWAARRVRAGGPVIPTRHDVWRALTWRLRTVRQFLAYAALMLGLLTLVMLVSAGDPIVMGSFVAPGPELSELRDDGAWRDESQPPGDEQRTDGQHYVFARRPGESFSTLVSIRNAWPVPITILGLLRQDGVTTAGLLEGSDAIQTGLGLLQDPHRIVSEPGNVVQFRAITLGPGEETGLVIGYSAGSCADPTADPATNMGPVDSSITLVYDLFGWRRTGEAWPPFELTVPAVAGCAR